MSDVIGRKVIPQTVHSVLGGVTPLALIQAGQQSAMVPAGLQHRFSYQLSDGWGNELLSYSAPTSRLAGKRLTLSYVPADQATADLIAGYLPKPHADGSPIQASELPTSLPGYLIRLKPQISLEGQVVAQSTSVVTMGSDLQGHGGFTQLYDPTQWDLSPDGSHVAGQATAIGISAGGVSAKQLDSLKTRLQNTKNQLQANSLQNLTGEQISGDLLTAVIWSWFAATESHNRLSQSRAQIIENPGLSYGLFHAVTQPIYSWGVVRQVTFPGMNIDIGHVRNINWAKDNDSRTWVSYNRLRGQYMSALESAAPERFFNDPKRCNLKDTTKTTANLPDCPHSISAVKALAIAAAQGQRIYTITQEVYRNNPNIVNMALSAHSYDTKNHVQQSLDAGNEVTIHERLIIESGWSGAGYTAIDPTTGAGAYTIEGGSNGAFTAGAQMAILLSITIALYAVSIPAGAGTALPAYLSIVFAGEFSHILSLYEGDEDKLACFWGGFFFAMGGIALLAGILTGGVLAGVTMAFLSWVLPGIFIPTNTALQCKAFYWQRWFMLIWSSVACLLIFAIYILGRKRNIGGRLLVQTLWVFLFFQWVNNFVFRFEDWIVGWVNVFFVILTLMIFFRSIITKKNN